RLSTIWRYDVATGARQQLTSDAFNASTPAFDAGGEHFFFTSYRNFSNVTSDWIQNRIINRELATVMDVPLRGTAFDVASFERRATRRIGGADAAATQAPAPAMPPMKVRVDLRAEWRELFVDAWRQYRDFFFAPKAPLADWPGVKVRYGAMIERCRTREEVNLVLAELIGESSVGHAYITNGGDVTPAPPPDAATLGADLAVENGAFRITRIIEAAPWEDAFRSPLRDAREGESIVAINDKPVDVSRDPRAALAGLAGKEVKVTLAAPRQSTSSGDGQRVITVTPLASEVELRRRAWIERNRRRVDEASGGRIGYIHIPDFTTNGFGDLARQYYGQIAKEALILDARWSIGGSTGATLAELFARRPLNYAASRYSENAWPAPRYGAHFGRKALLVNHITVSAGENFSSYFRKLALGPIVGSRTWGGLTGLNITPSLIDGGAVNIPNAPFFDESGWLIEGHGLDPDVVVEGDPDAQLDAAVKALDYSSRPHD
ncbi:MAG TPA: S41 family peptidase, partial [Thermoanaerobaculia bacterium]|nr:S41 family peptidase [Thermoanaerobaculia bacterium]